MNFIDKFNDREVFCVQKRIDKNKNIWKLTKKCIGQLDEYGNWKIIKIGEHGFWYFVDIKGEKECWNWKGDRDHGGYGTFRFCSNSYTTHRLSYEIVKGDIPEGMIVCHMCDNPGCVNPNHLYIGIVKDNANDARIRGRNRYGKCKDMLDNEERKLVLLLFDEGYTKTQIIKKFKELGYSLNRKQVDNAFY